MNPMPTFLCANIWIVAVLLAAVASKASAQDFLGQNVTMGHYAPDTSTVYDGPFSVTVSLGSGDRQLITPFLDRHPGYGVNIESDRVIVDFVDAVNFSPMSYHGLIINNLTSGGTISISETASHRILSYDGSTLLLDWAGILVPNGSTYTIMFTPVPEPGTLAMFGTASLAMLLYRRGKNSFGKM